jgi:hypothetical protein
MRTEIRVRVNDPGRYQEDSFRRKTLRAGVTAIVARPRGSTSTEIQALRFSRSLFTPARAIRWAIAHGFKSAALDPEDDPHVSGRFAVYDCPTEGSAADLARALRAVGWAAQATGSFVATDAPAGAVRVR